MPLLLQSGSTFLDLVKVILLGILQGLAEFLPISSSGHLVLFGNLFGLDDGGLLLDTLLHVGTLAAVLFVYHKRILQMLRNPLGRDVRLLVVATVPAVIVALLFQEQIEALFSGGLWLGICFLITAALLYFSERIAKRQRAGRTELSYLDALAMGACQAIAIPPGISRSGATISGGLFCGLDRMAAADFSFLMSIPAILGSLVLQAKDLAQGADPAGGWGIALVGMVVAAVVGVFAIKTMLVVLRKLNLKWFALYTLVLGLFLVLNSTVLHLF